MADMFLKIGSVSPDPKHFQDGDIVGVMNNRRIKSSHASTICSVQKTGFDSSGFKVRNSLAYKYLELTSQYQFERVSLFEVIRREISLGLEDTISNIPNSKGEYINVGIFISRRLEQGGSAIFKAPSGNPTWFGGKTLFSASVLSLVWKMIETNSVKRESDHFEWGFSAHEKREFLVMRIKNVTDSKARALTSSVEIAQFGTKVLTHKRRNFISWDSIGIGVNPDEIRDKRRIVEVRKLKSHDTSTIARARP